MIRMHNLPEQINQALKPYYKQNETPDVFPSIFRVDGNDYYFFTFAPAEEQLIMERSGRVPYYDEIERVALIAADFNSSIETTVTSGVNLVHVSFEENYKKLSVILNEIEQNLKPLPGEIQADLEKFRQAVTGILEDQKLMKDQFMEIIQIWDRIKMSEIATEEDQKRAREHRLFLAKTAYQQNARQLQSEQARQNVIKFLKGQRSFRKPSIWKLYLQLRPYEKFMMDKVSYKKDMEEMEGLVSRGNIPLEQEAFAAEYLADLRNPRRSEILS